MTTRFFRCRSTALPVAVLALGFAAGCGDRPTTPMSAQAGSDPHADHPIQGPHHGALIELGDEEYHAEFVHDETKGRIAVYLLDSAAEKAVPVDAETLTVHVKSGGKVVQFPLKAEPLAGETGGQSSCFTSTDEALDQAIDADGAEAKLQVTIAGTPYTGSIAHHDHGEDHKH